MMRRREAACSTAALARRGAVPERDRRSPALGRSSSCGISAIRSGSAPSTVFVPSSTVTRPLGRVAQREAADAERRRLLLDAARVGEDEARPRPRARGRRGSRAARSAITPASRRRRVVAGRLAGCCACAGGRERRPGMSAASTTSPSTVAASSVGIVDERGAVQRHERVAARARRPNSLPAASRSRASRRARAASRSSCCRRSGLPASMPSRSRLSIACRECTSRSRDRWSVRTRLCSSGMRRSKLRSPASRCATGMSSFTAASAPASVELTSPDTTTRRAALEQHLLDADERARRLLGVRARADAEEDVRRRQPELVEEDRPTCRRRSAAPCARARARARDRAPAAQRWTGAAFMKFGRAPTTKQDRGGHASMLATKAAGRASRQAAGSAAGGIW